MIDLAPLFTAQEALDAHINAEHPPQDGEDRLGKLILALNVELGECANEWRGFKFWSKDQEARWSDPSCDFCEGRGTYEIHTTMPDYPDVVTCDKCKNPLLEEYVDALHFILSIGNHTGRAKAWIAVWGDDVLTIEEFDIVCQFNTVFVLVGDFFKDQSAFDYCVLVKAFLGLGKMLGFTDEQIVEAYHAKRKVNHERQQNGY